MNRQSTDPLQGPQPRTIRIRLPLHTDCARFDNRLNRVRFPGSLQSPLHPVPIEPRCQAVYSAFFVHQLKVLTAYAKHRRLSQTAIEPFDPSTMPSSCKDIRTFPSLRQSPIVSSCSFPSYANIITLFPQVPP